MATPPSPSGAFGGVGQPGMELFESNTIVTASHPSWPGQNVYIAGGTSLSGAIPVVIISGSGGGSSVPQPVSSSAGSFAYHSSSSKLILSASSTRVTFKVYNDTSSNYIITFGLTASLTKIMTFVPPQWTYEDPYPGWQGPVAGIGVGGGSGTIYWTELR